jgi:2-iminobutanoate/2-iminopropanoate deaminase
MKHGSPMPQGVIANGFVFLSAIRGVNESRSDLAAGAEAQARRAFEIARTILAEAGSGLDDVVRVGIYMKNLQSSRPSFNKVWRELYGDGGPARFAVEVTDIGGAGDDTELLLDIIAVAGNQRH